MSEPLNYSELHQELVNEFFYYADKRGPSYFNHLQDMYWRARGVAYTGCVTNLPGTKFIISTDDTASLTNKVRKALMFADHAVIRYATKLPVSGLVLGAIPVDFAGFKRLDWVEKHLPELEGSPIIPHFRSTPPEPDLKPFIEWLCGEGRNWFKTHQVTFVPNLCPGEVDLSLYAEGVNLNSIYRGAGFLPDDFRRLNTRAAKALLDLQIPYIEGLTPELLYEFKQDEAEAVQRFQHYVLKLIEQINEDVAPTSFAAKVEEISSEIVERTNILEAAIRKRLKSRNWGLAGAGILSVAAGVFYLTGLPAAALGSLVGSAVALAKEMKDGLKDKYSIKSDPVFILARMGKVSRCPKTWHPRIRG
jgi:hypothetical protein